MTVLYPGWGQILMLPQTGLVAEAPLTSLSLSFLNCKMGKCQHLPQVAGVRPL